MSGRKLEKRGALRSSVSEPCVRVVVEASSGSVAGRFLPVHSIITILAQSPLSVWQGGSSGLFFLFVKASRQLSVILCVS